MSEPSIHPDQPKPSGVTLVNCRLEKTQNFQSVFVIGAWGRISGHGEIILSMFNELPDLASNVVYSKDADGKFFGVPKLEYRHDAETLVREIPVDLIMTLDAAKRIRATLDHFIEQREQRDAQKAQALTAQKAP
ncbi:MAG: hypothetical protein ABSG78_22765 [Verrucomicrobiota bacterium]|jgi:hypothetical protein